MHVGGCTVTSGPFGRFLCCFMYCLFCVVLCIVCKCVLHYCHRVAIQLQFNKYIVYHIILFTRLADLLWNRDSVAMIGWIGHGLEDREIVLRLLAWVRECLPSLKYNQLDAALYNILYYCQCCTCFRRFLRPSSGAQKLYTQHPVYAKRGWVGTEFQLTHASGSSKQAWHIPDAVCTVFELLMIGGETI